MIFRLGGRLCVCFALMLTLLLCQNQPAAGFSIGSLTSSRSRHDAPPKVAELPRDTHSSVSESYSSDRPERPEYPTDIDRIDDRTLRDLLLLELGSGTEHLLRTLFGDFGRGSSLMSKRSNAQPKFNPGWKFIGLGKKRSLSPVISGKPKDAVFAYQWNAPVENLDVSDPYLGALALSNLDKFFNAVKEEIYGNPQTTEDGKNPGDVSSSGPRGPPVNPRFRNKLSLWSGQPKTLYDPGWLMAGLGR